MAQDTMLAAVGIVVKEPWADNISYEMLNYTLWRVQDGGDGCGYVALKDNIGVTPGTDDTVWRKAVEAGQSIYDLAVKYHHFEGTEEEFEAEYQAALQAARDAAAGATAVEAQVEAAEGLRVEAESGRVSAEGGRVSAEAARATAEGQREEAELARRTSENSRIDAETQRELAETARNTAESARQTAESSRESAEAQRVSETAAAIIDANTARDQADAAAAAANAAAGRAPYIGENGNWFVWSVQQNQYVDSGVDASAPELTIDPDYTIRKDGEVFTEAIKDANEQAQADHTQALADHQVMQGYDTRLTKAETDISQLGQKVGRIEIPITKTKKYIKTNTGVGEQIGAETTDNVFSYMRYPVLPGDFVIVNGTGGGAPRLWAFIDSYEIILSVAEPSVSASNLIIEAPQNAAEIIINTSDTSVPSYFVKKDTCEGQIIRVNDKTDKIGENVERLDREKNIWCYYGNISAYSFWPNETNIPAGASVTNTGTVDVRLYDTNDPNSANFVKVDAGKTITTTFVTRAIRGIATSGDFSLVVVRDANFLVRNILDGAVTSQKIASNAVTTPKIANGAVTIDKLDCDIVKSSNLYDKNDQDCVPEKYIYPVNGTLQSNSTYKASGWIPVIPGAKYIGAHAYHYAFYDSEKTYIAESGGNNLYSQAVTAPENAAYLRFSAKIAEDNLAQINEGDVLLAYEPYYNYASFPGLVPTNSDLDKNGLFETIAARSKRVFLSMGDDAVGNGESIILADYPKSLKQGDKLSLYAKVTTWGNGITIGKGTTDYTAGYVDISATQVIFKYYAAGAETIIETKEHGLTIESFIKVIIDISATKWTLILQTLQGTYTTEQTCKYNNGAPRMKSNGAVLQDVVLSATNIYFSHPVWMFGDSYFGIAEQNRELYWLKEWGYLNCLVQGFPGQASQAAYDDFQRCLAISKPRYIVWTLGMNDNSGLDAWRTFVTNIKAICEKYDIILVLGTIPKPLSNAYTYKDEMSAWIRSESGCRYIDVAKAVGSDENGHWYGYGETYDYQSTDNVHPSVYGAKAIATQFLADFPEIMQY